MDKTLMQELEELRGWPNDIDPSSIRDILNRHSSSVIVELTPMETLVLFQGYANTSIEREALIDATNKLRDLLK